MEQTPKKSACKKGKVESTEFRPEDKLIFYGPSEKSKFESYKSKSMAYGRSFVWIRQYMLESIRDISSSAACLPYGLLISYILEVMKVDLAPFTPKHITSTYDKTAFSMMGYTLGDDGWVKRAKVESVPVPVEAQTEQPESLSTASQNLQQIQQYLDGVKLLIVEMKEQVDKIREVTKETGTDVSKLRMDMGATRRQGTTTFNFMSE
ncbi:hypothetical protein A4A49_31484 [Nicotiana attenuata]|uniref:Uncharacterized protein n=1 Tax=Nicotiana attenuata TaxID=49451 RepID=A0A1J6IAB3_NICAT|nr:hypothetical protein A4A49_31484 [Nicotiana attenuata]